MPGKNRKSTQRWCCGGFELLLLLNSQSKPEQAWATFVLDGEKTPTSFSMRPMAQRLGFEASAFLTVKGPSHMVSLKASSDCQVQETRLKTPSDSRRNLSPSTLELLAHGGRANKRTWRSCVSSEFWGNEIMILALTAKDKFNLHAPGRIWKNHLNWNKESPNCKSIVANITHPSGMCWPLSPVTLLQHSL